MRDTHQPTGAADAAWTPRMLVQAPHRLLFFVGAVDVLLAMAWWTGWLAAARWAPSHLSATQLPDGWTHALVMQYQVLPPFMFGFLLTVFPRWTGTPDLPRMAYIPVGMGLLLGQVLVIAGACMGVDGCVRAGWLLTLGAWAYGCVHLLRVLLTERAASKGPTWHAWSCFLALALGLSGLLCVNAALWSAQVHPRWIEAAIKIGSFGLLLPIYVTVAHRMFPFFAGNVVPGYTPWRPLWLLGVLWSLFVAHLLLELAHALAWLWLVDGAIAVLTAFVLYRWWPRARAPGLLWVLFIGLAWLPVAFALYTVQSAALAATETFILGRGPAHALFIGFFGSLLVAMVTRVTQGHSGRPLEMPPVGWFAFVLLQLVTVWRIAAEMAADPFAWHVIAGAGWLLAFLPWVLRSLSIYASPRADGKPG